MSARYALPRIALLSKIIPILDGEGQIVVGMAAWDGDSAVPSPPCGI